MFAGPPMLFYLIPRETATEIRQIKQAPLFAMTAAF
jgi:hypothetical protein